MKAEDTIELESLVTHLDYILITIERLDVLFLVEY
jgi:hypothetical protein